MKNVSSYTGSSAPDHYLAYAFATIPTIKGEVSGGLPSVIAEELRRRISSTRASDLHIISADQSSVELTDMQARVIAAQPETKANNEKFQIWFDEEWALFHPDIATLSGASPEILTQMFQGEYTQPQGSVERMLEHFDKYGLFKNHKGANPLEVFTDRFDQAVNNIKPGTVVNWQDFFFTNVILRNAKKLRSKGCYQTFHLHVTLPPNLYLSERGKETLKALSLMDRVYLHTDQYVKNLQRQLERLDLPVPDIRRFDLGIDRRAMDQGLKEVGKENYQERPEFQTLNYEEKGTLSEIYDSQDVIPHRFICIDRTDQIKGPHVVVGAIDKYLGNLGLNIEELRKKYRFFFVNDDEKRISFDKYNLKHQYIKYTKDALRSLISKYPGVIFNCHSIPRIFIPSSLSGAHSMTGGIQEGLNLATQESLYVNATLGKNNTAIIGTGTGFAMQTMDDGYGHLASFSKAGSVGNFVNHLGIVVKEAEEHPTVIGNRTREMLAKVINKRTDSIIVNP